MAREGLEARELVTLGDQLAIGSDGKFRKVT